MTLVELTVVLVILSLLAVTVLPLLNRSPNKSLLREAAATVQGHISQSMSKSIGNRTGCGAWFDFDLTGTTSGQKSASILAFCPGMTTATHSSSLTTTSATAISATLNSPLNPTAVLGPSVSQFPAGTLISFMGYPYDYQLDPTGATASLRAVASQTFYNTTFPYNSGTSAGPNPTYSCVVSVPPTRTFGIKSALRGNACIDLGCSTVGVAGYSNLAAQIPTAPLVITFDSTGRGRCAVFPPATIPFTSTKSLRSLDASTPVALLIGMSDQVGNNWVASPSEDDPGSNLQRSDALWVVYDPRTSSAFVVENFVASSSPGAITAAHIASAQKLVRQSLLNRLNSN